MHIYTMVYFAIAIVLFGFVTAMWNRVDDDKSITAFVTVVVICILWPIGVPFALYVNKHYDRIVAWLEKHFPE